MEQTDSHQRVGGFGDWMKEGKGDIYIYNLIHKHRLKYVYSQRKGELGTGGGEQRRD